MKKWDKTIKPSLYICPEKYCFFWHEGKCDEAYKAFDISNECIRNPLCKSNVSDWYEPCEPELRRDGLPDDYFINKWT